MTGSQAMSCVSLIGNPRPGSRTQTLVEGVAAQLAEEVPNLHVTHSFDLASVGDLRDVREALRAAQVAVVGSPVYKGTFTSLLKSVFDGLDADDLFGVVAVPVMLAASPLHVHGANSYLRPLLEEVGATVPLPGRCWLESELTELEASVTEWGRRTGWLYRKLLTPAGLLSG